MAGRPTRVVTKVDAAAGLRLRAYLNSGPPTPAEIARQAGCSRQWIWTILSGKAKPSPRVIEACEELGVPIEVVFGGE